MSRNRWFCVGFLSLILGGVSVAAQDATNQPPVVRFVFPQDGAVIAGATQLHLVAFAQDREDGYKLKVEFFNGTESLGVATFVPTLCPAPYCPNFALNWSNVVAGSYTLTAVATDTQGAATTSGEIHIQVVEFTPPPPVVTIVAKDPLATEQSPLVDALPDTATFVVHRWGGDLASPLTVSYRVGGTAENGVDYDKLPGSVTIPAQAENAEIVINPIDDDLSEATETIVLGLLPGYPPCLFATPPCEIPTPAVPAYYVGVPGEAIAYLRDNDPENLRPEVAIVKPLNGDTFPAGSDIAIGVRARDPDGWVHQVEFFANDVKIGEQSIEFIVAPPPGQVQEFSLVWSNVNAGPYILTARATDGTGLAGRSAPVTIAVGDVVPLVPIVTLFAPDAFASENVSTNGTNTATFRFVRTGPTNSDLTVFYSVHGTASNGVDYAELPGWVTIPAGRHSARVVIVPVDDDLVEGLETVILRLEPDPSLGPVARYQVGWPAKAAAVIVDNDGRPISSWRLPDGSFHLCQPQTNGFTFSLEASEDLSSWVSLGSYVVVEGSLHYVDSEAPGHSRRFYRIVPQTNYVPEE